MSDISFLVPTLNRDGLVQRAVRSCLVALDRAHADGEVVVLDSESDDGSWEGLQREFAEEPRVVLRQNLRGLGPTRSWLDAAQDISGDAVTYVWSDDYVAPDFLLHLLPPLKRGAPLAIGWGAIRPVDCEDPFRKDARVTSLPAREIAAEYFGTARHGLPLPMSPTAALFQRDSFDAWLAEVERTSTADPLREHFMWDRAIGPDLLLFLIALAQSPTAEVPFVHQPVAQFSSHGGSITLATSRWNVMVGYWLARAAVLRDHDRLDTLTAPSQALGHAVLQGAWLAMHASAPVGPLMRTAQVRAAIWSEIAALRLMCNGRGGVAALCKGMTRSLITHVRRTL